MSKTVFLSLILYLSIITSGCCIDGSGSCKVNTSQNLEVSIDGSGDVYYLGDAKVSQKINGSGKIVNSN